MILGTKLHDACMEGLTAEAWAYPATKSTRVYVRLLRAGRHVVTVSLRVPAPKPRSTETIARIIEAHIARLPAPKRAAHLERVIARLERARRNGQ